LLGSPVRHVLSIGNVFAASNERSPRLTNGNIVAVFNNFIYGPGVLSTHVDTNQLHQGAARIDIIGNIYRPSQDTLCHRPMIRVTPDFAASDPPSAVFLRDNTEIETTRFPCFAD